MMEPPIDMNLSIPGEPDSWVHSACLLCSNGCGMDIGFKDGRIVGVRGQPNHPVNFGHLGPKGEHAWVANNSKRHGTMPMIRHTKGSDMEEASWDEALDFFMEKFELERTRSHENLGCYNSGQLTLEEFYTLGKLWRGGLQSSNIDGNTRLCTATYATGLMTNFGADGPVAGYVDIDAADLLCLYGHKCCGDADGIVGADAGCEEAEQWPHHRLRPSQEPYGTPGCRSPPASKTGNKRGVDEWHHSFADRERCGRSGFC